MALTNPEFIHPQSLVGGTGQWKYTYATVPDNYADWPAYIDGLISAAPYSDDTKNKQWVYVELLTLAVEEEQANDPTYGITSFRDGDLTVDLSKPKTKLEKLLSFWDGLLSGKSYGSRLTTIESHF